MKSASLVCSVVVTLLSAMADDAPTLTFDGIGYTFHRAENTSSSLQNYYYPTGKKPEDSAAQIVRGALIGKSDCLAFAKGAGAGLKKRQPDAVFSIVPDSNARVAMFAQVASSENGATHVLEVWHLVQPNPKFPTILGTQLSILAKGDEGRAKLKGLLDARIKDWIGELQAAKYPEPFLPFKAENVGDHEVAGGLVKMKGFTAGVSYTVDAKFAEKLKAPKPPSAPFKVTIPTKFKDEVVINGAPNVPETAVFAITDDDKNIIESVHFTELRHEKLVDVGEKLAFFAALLEVQSVGPMVLSQGGQIIDRYRTKIRGLDAAVVLTGTKRADGSTFFQKFIAIPKPNSEFGIFAMAKMDSAKSADVKTPADTASKGFAAQVLHSFSFIE